MALTPCRECSQQISTEAPTCPHCGVPAPTGDCEPGLAERGGIGSRFRSGLLAARSATERVAAHAKVSAADAAAWGREQSERVLERAQDATTQIAGLVIRDCAVPAYLLPTGSGPADFLCVFQFDAVVAQLGAGRLVRPRIVAWAGRADIDRVHLAGLLRETFATQLSAARAAASSPDRMQVARVQDLEAAQQKTGERTQSAVRVLATGLVATALITNPIFNLLLLALAVYGGSAVVSNTLRHFQASNELRKAEAEISADRRDLERELDAGSARFRSAVERLDLVVHPVLAEIVREICDLDCAPPPMSARAAHSGPDVRAALASGAYRAQVPAWIHPLLDQGVGA